MVVQASQSLAFVGYRGRPIYLNRLFKHILGIGGLGGKSRPIAIGHGAAPTRGAPASTRNCRMTGVTPSQTRPARILIVDDEDHVIRLLTQFFTSRGRLVGWADSVAKCLAARDDFTDI